MTKRTARIGLIILYSMILSAGSSCSAAQLVSPPKLEDRRLRLRPDSPGVAFYEFHVCVKRFLGICTKTEMKEEDFHMTDAVVWKQLIDMGFTLTSERRWQ